MRISWKISAILVVCSLLISILVIILGSGSTNIENSKNPANISYTAHAPIIINSDAGFLGPNASTGITRGSGTALDPYFIEGWAINAAGFKDSIYIGNTSAHFRITKCYVNGGSRDGIQLYRTSNGTIDCNDCGNLVLNGILLSESSNNTIVNNDCSQSNGQGILLKIQCKHNLIENNTCFARPNSNGIYLWNSDENTITKNNCSDILWAVGNGMVLYGSNNNTITTNTFFNNGQYGLQLGAGSNDNKITSNTFSENGAYGLRIGDSGNVVWSNIFIKNNGSGIIFDPAHIQARDDGTSNRWYAVGLPVGYGNYWSDWQPPEHPDINGDGIIDTPYNISGSSGSQDLFPLLCETVGIPEPPLIFLIALMTIIFILIGRQGRR